MVIYDSYHYILAKKINKQRQIIFSLRDVLAWVEFFNESIHILGTEMAFVHGTVDLMVLGGSMVVVDSIGSNTLFGSLGNVFDLRQECLLALYEFAGISPQTKAQEIVRDDAAGRFGMAPFFISRGNMPIKECKFAIHAPTTQQNCKRVLRAMQLKKPILLEGAPGVGKTSLIASCKSLSNVC